MEYNENNQNHFVIIGGCHVSGFGAEGNPSFVDVIEKTLNLKSVFKKSNFQLQHADRLRFILENYQSDLILLQVGNNEFNASLKHILLFLNKYKNRTTSPSKVSFERSNTFNWRKNTLCDFLVSVVKFVLVNFIWICEKTRSKEYLCKFKSIIRENDNKIFVIISPFPSFHIPSNITRKRAGLYYKRLFNLPNVVFINSFENFPISKNMFFDRYHLNGLGHERLGKRIANEMLILFDV